METSAYIQILQHLRSKNKPVHPHDLSLALGKSRVTIQSSLKRLMKNGWVEKIGESPKTMYRSLELSLVPRETQTKDIPLLKKAESQSASGLLEQFIHNSHKIRYTMPMKPLIVFDLDGTLTPTSSWEALNALLGISTEDDYRLFKEYTSGTLEYTDWIAQLVEIHKKTGKTVARTEIESLAHTISLSEGAQETVQYAKDKGYETVLISGSVNTIVEIMAQRLGIAEWRACSTVMYNVESGLIDIVSMGDERLAKLNVLKTYCEKRGYALENTITVGDGGSELEIFKHTKGILIGNNAELAPVAWKQVANLSEIKEML